MTATDISAVATFAPRAQARANRRARARMWDRIATGALWAVAGFIALVFAYVCGYTILNGAAYINWRFLTSGDPAVGIGPQILNTFYLLILSLVFMIPVGIGTAIYVTEYARNERMLKVLRFATETLTSAPTLIIGLFGYLLFVTSLPILRLGPVTIHGLGLAPSRIAGALTLAVLNVPWMLRTAEDALRAVPRSLREASLAMGATRWQTTLRVVIPAAIPGLITSLLITAGRVTGETAALVFTTSPEGVNVAGTNLSLSGHGETLAAHIYFLFAEPYANGTALRLGSSLVLIVLVLLFNIAARFVGEWLHRRASGRRA